MSRPIVGSATVDDRQIDDRHEERDRQHRERAPAVDLGDLHCPCASGLTMSRRDAAVDTRKGRVMADTAMVTVNSSGDRPSLAGRWADEQLADRLLAKA